MKVRPFNFPDCCFDVASKSLYLEIVEQKTLIIFVISVFKFGPVTVAGGAIFLRTSQSVAFVNKKPVVEGHVLVSSARQVPKLSDLSTDEVEDLFKLVQKVDSFIQEFYNVDSTTISIQSELRQA